ncbi:hypothetical protein SAMN05880558_10538 [Aeromonas sp. RU39B]|jgi:hypothetical protein|uniref:hypothetical protein n=1 Tax=Aeromonas sp. RU39B TaxID=1907416 RepID=UPI000954F212|nr:hypothetical protein [Aeromonas sp. RU39B]SIQ71437.1 hypothetical protein SAMN05880558_10538 [Aeromonas sp. RU39B]
MGKAADTYGQITREQYQDWLTRFYPKQKQLMELATDESLMRDQLGRVDANSANALASAQQATANRNARMGVASTSTDNTQGLRSALMTAGSENAIRDQEKTRQLNILTGADAGLREAIKTGGA